MDDPELRALSELLKPLLQALEVLGFVARHFHPPQFGALLQAIGTPEDELIVARAARQPWSARLSQVGAALDEASDAAIEAFLGLRAAARDSNGVRAGFGALRQLPRALEALYPLAAVAPPVNRFFLEPDRRGDLELEASFLAGEGRRDAGVMCFGEGRGGFWLYVPETAAPGAPVPLVMALHGGSGDGRRFLWTWLRAARTRGALLAAPSSVGRTWALSGPDPDTSNLQRILEFVRGRWSVDPDRLLLTGLSDGGTFTFASGLGADSPFTHLAPVSAAFHPLLAMTSDPERLRGLPIHVAHGALDWMFPVDMAREAQRILCAAGAAVTYAEIEDLSHTYPRELNGPILQWLDDTPPRRN
jgi:phospholipase/carboxylesterase